MTWRATVTVLVLLATASSGVAAEAPSTQPAITPSATIQRATTQPAAMPAAAVNPIADTLAKLADPDPAIRDGARVSLMGLSPGDLPTLKAALSARPLLPAQAVALRSVVGYILTRDALRAIPTRGEPFLGVRLPVTFIDAGDNQAVLPAGVPVLFRLPGFVGRRYLEEGDLILGFVLDSGREWVRTRGELMSVIGQFKPGQTLVLIIQRGGQTLDVPLALDAKPRPGGASEEEEFVRLMNLLTDAEKEADRAFEESMKPFAGAVD